MQNRASDPVTPLTASSHIGAGGVENLNPNALSDPFAPTLVYDLLQGKNEWKNIQDIVKLTFKAVCDTVKSQGQAIRDIENGLH